MPTVAGLELEPTCRFESGFVGGTCVATIAAGAEPLEAKAYCQAAPAPPVVLSP